MSETHDQAAPQRGDDGTTKATAARTEAADRPSAASGYVPRPAPGYDDVGYREPSGAVLGLTMLAATFLIVTGALGFLEGLAAVTRGSFFVTLPNYTFSMSATGWGIVHMALGVLMVAAGCALFAGRLWARIVAVILAAAVMVANFVYLPYYPVWSIVVIALSAFVIWALLSPRHD